MSILAGIADISLGQLLLVACVALLASVVGGLACYGTGALMPLVLVPVRIHTAILDAAVHHRRRGHDIDGGAALIS